MLTHCIWCLQLYAAANRQQDSDGSHVLCFKKYCKESVTLDFLKKKRLSLYTC